MTYSSIFASVTAFCKADVPQGGKVTTVIDGCIQRTYYNIVRSRKFPELLQNRTSATMTGSSTTGLVTFTTWGLLMDIDQIDFNSGGIEWTLDEISKRVTPSAVDGKPRAYRKVGSSSADGDKLYLDPFATIAESTDKCYVTWYKLPPQLAGTGAGGTTVDTAPYLHSIDAELVDRACAEVLNYYGAVEKAKMILMKYQSNPGSSPSGSVAN